MKLNLLTANSDISMKQDCTGPPTEHHLHINTEEMIIDQLESRHLLTRGHDIGNWTYLAHAYGNGPSVSLFSLQTLNVDSVPITPLIHTSETMV